MYKRENIKTELAAASRNLNQNKALSVTPRVTDPRCSLARLEPKDNKTSAKDTAYLLAFRNHARLADHIRAEQKSLAANAAEPGLHPGRSVILGFFDTRTIRD